MKFHSGLEGLRGVSVLAVLIFHAGFGWMQGGFLGVSTFFTLSGFLITRSILEEQAREGRFDLPGFWVRRLRRLMPAALVALLLTAAFAEFSGHVTQRMRATEDGLAALVYLSNWWFIATDSGYEGLLGYPSPVQHFWSLSIEEQFYLVYPFLLLATLQLTRRSQRAAGAVIAAIAGVAWIGLVWLESQGATTERLYYGTDTRSGELLAGCALALLLPGGEASASRTKRLALDAVGILGALVSVYFWTTARADSESLYLGGLQLYTLSSVAIIASAVRSPGLLGRVLSLRPARWLGRISYGAYLYHWPIYLWLDGERFPLAGPSLTLVRVALTLALAHLSYTWLEEPVRTGRRLRGGPIALATLTGMLAVALALVVATRDVEPSHTLASVFQRQRPLPDTVPDETPRIMVVGDSIAQQLAAGLTLVDHSLDATILNAAGAGCGLARGARVKETTRGEEACDDWDQRYRGTLEAERPNVVLVYVAGWDLVPRRRPEWSEAKTIHASEYVRWLRDEYEAAVRLFSSQGAHVAWVTPLCTRDGGDPLQRRLLASEVIEPMASSFPDRVTVIDLDSIVCPGGRFTNDFEGIEPFRPDGNHFSLSGRVWVAFWLGQRIDEILDRTRPGREAAR